MVASLSKQCLENSTQAHPNNIITAKPNCLFNHWVASSLVVDKLKKKTSANQVGCVNHNVVTWLYTSWRDSSFQRFTLWYERLIA